MTLSGQCHRSASPLRSPSRAGALLSLAEGKQAGLEHERGVSLRIFSTLSVFPFGHWLLSCGEHQLWGQIQYLVVEKQEPGDIYLWDMKELSAGQ